jgi:hypothetical protein
MDEIRVGLDFGTHQTKICVSRIPDEGHGVPEYEFFQFADLKGMAQYFIPSVIQINKDDTLSYGYVDPKDEKESMPLPRMDVIEPVDTNNIEENARELYLKYSTEEGDEEESIAVLIKMLQKKYEIDKITYKDKLEKAQTKYEEEKATYNRERNLFRYFKQSTFAEYPWECKIRPEILCVWYLAYILFLLEDRYPDGFAINMGIPTDDKNYRQKQELGTQVLMTAYHLVEDVYQKDLKAFLKEKVNNLIAKTEMLPFSEDDKEINRINIFPEAYASLIGLTSRGKLSEGMSINADIGGGTTDISFFVVRGKIPKIYKYWSIPRGLNYIAEMSGFDYSEKDLIKNARKDIIDKFNHKKEEIIYNLERKLIEIVRDRGILKSNLFKALKDRILVYNGGGSTYPEISTPINLFSDVIIADAELWSEEIVKIKTEVGKLFNLLTTAYGLSVSEDDNDVVLCDIDTLLAPSVNNERNERQEIDKDLC